MGNPSPAAARPVRLFFWPLDEAGRPLGEPAKFTAFICAVPSRIGWFSKETRAEFYREPVDA